MTKDDVKQALQFVWALRGLFAINMWIGLFFLLGFTILRMGELLWEGQTIPIGLLGMSTLLYVPWFLLTLWIQKEGKKGKKPLP